MQARKKHKKRPYYGRKGGAAEYKNEMKFDIYSTLKALRDYYEGKSNEEKRN